MTVWDSQRKWDIGAFRSGTMRCIDPDWRFGELRERGACS
jgi:hypothetical protein